VERWLRAQGFTDIRPNAERMEVRYTRNGGQGMLSLGNLMREYVNTPRKARADLLERFLSGALVAEDSTPTDYATAKPKLMPVVRSVGGMALARQGVAGAAPKPGTQPVQRPLVADLAVGLVIDLPTSMAYVQEKALDDWGVTWEQALQDAIANLRGLPEHGGWKQIAPGVWSGEWGDSYESSRLLIPDLIYRVGISDPVAMAPFRDSLLVTSAANPEGIAKMVQIAHDALNDRGRWVSFELLRLDGTTWLPFTPTGEAATHQAQMMVRSRAEDYESQRHILDGQLEDQQLDIFVASCSLLRKGDGPITSYAVWSEDVDTLLPEADSVVLIYKDGDKDWLTRLPWGVVREQFGHLMEPTDYVPTRYRLRQFPERDALHQLAATAGLDG